MTWGGSSAAPNSFGGVRMATRCVIGRKLEDGKIEAIYCHFDGYPRHTGTLLVGKYNTQEKVKGLLKLGDISILRGNLSETIAYRRDHGRNWEDVAPKTFESFEEFCDWGCSVYAEFVYLFDEEGWHCFDSQGYEIKLEKYIE